MAVANQTPYKEYIGNGTTKIFPLEFDCDDADHLIVKVNDVDIPALNNWSLNTNTGSVVFAIAPISQSKIILQRDTPLVRDTDYQTYNNSFRPQPVNKDFDRIWLKLQELGHRDQLIWLALVKEIADRIAVDKNLQNQINAIDSWLEDLQQNVNENTSDIAQLVNDLSKEIADRITNDLILKDMFLTIIDTAINEGTVNALAITHVDSLDTLDKIKNVWDGRIIYVNALGNYKYSESLKDWISLDNNIIRTVNSIAELDDLEKIDGRTVCVTGIGNYKYNGTTQAWERDFITDRQIVNIEAITDLGNIQTWENRAVYTTGIGQLKFVDDDWQRDIILANSLNLLDFIPYRLHAHLADYNTARNSAVDIYPYLMKCITFAENLKKSIYVPSGYYPISQTVIHPNFVNVLGDYGKTWIIPSKAFPEFNWLWDMTKTGMAGNQLNGVSFHGNDWNYQTPYFGGLKVSGKTWFCCVKNARFMNLNYGGFRIAPRYNAGESGVPDLVNFNIENIFFLDCGSISYHPAFDIDLSDESDTVLSGNWTDGSIKNIDIAIADGDQVNTRGPIGFRIKSPLKTIFNVVFDRFFIGTRLQTHMHIDATNLNGNTFSNFSGETHTTIYNGKTMNDVAWDTYQLHFENLGQWNTFQNINGNMSLGDFVSKQKGMYLNKSSNNTFNNMPLNASYAGNQVELLNLTSNARYTTFDNCAVRLIDDKNWNLAWGIANNLFTKTIIDKGVNTKFNGQQVNSLAVKDRAMPYYSLLNTAGTAPQNAISGNYGGLSFSQNATTSALTVTLAASTSTRELNFYYSNKQSSKPVYFVTITAKQTAGSLAANKLRFGMFDQTYDFSFDALNASKKLTYVFNSGLGVDALVVYLANTAATTEAASFEITDIYVSSQMLPYTPNCSIISAS